MAILDRGIEYNIENIPLHAHWSWKPWVDGGKSHEYDAIVCFGVDLRAEDSESKSLQREVLVRQIERK